jgi:hypothetical protein
MLYQNLYKPHFAVMFPYTNEEISIATLMQYFKENSFNFKHCISVSTLDCQVSPDYVLGNYMAKYLPNVVYYEDAFYFKFQSDKLAVLADYVAGDIVIPNAEEIYDYLMSTN